MEMTTTKQKQWRQIAKNLGAKYDSKELTNVIREVYGTPEDHKETEGTTASPGSGISALAVLATLPHNHKKKSA